MTFGLAYPSPSLCVGRECLGLGPLGTEHGEARYLGLEAGAVFADVGVGASTLGRRPQAVAAGEAGLDGRGVTPVLAVVEWDAGVPGRERSETGFRQIERPLVLCPDGGVEQPPVAQTHLGGHMAEEGHERLEGDSGVHHGRGKRMAQLVRRHVADAGAVSGPVELESQCLLGEAAAVMGELTDRLQVDLRQRYTSYSKGDKQKIALIIALAHQPDLLILDEPTSGLDPIVQQEFYALVGEARAAGRTVFLSSHVLSEVERVCDRAAIIRDGAIAAVEEIGALRDALHHQVEIRFAGPVPVERFASLAGVSDVSSGGDVLTMRVTGPIGPVVSRAAEFGVVDFISREPSLEEIFLARYRAAEPEPAGGAK